MADAEPDAAALSDLLFGISRVLRRRLRRDIEASRLRGAQAELLRLVVERPGIGVSAAARELYLAGNSVSTVVNKLVEAGLLRRETDPQDRRSALLLPTPDAVKRLRLRDERRRALVRDQVAGLSAADRAALDAALPALRRLAQGLHDDLEGA